MIDIILALLISGLIYGVARLVGRCPDYTRIAAWTAVVVLALGIAGQLALAASGDGDPQVYRVFPIMVFAVYMFRCNRGGSEGVSEPSEPQQATP